MNYKQFNNEYSDLLNDELVKKYCRIFWRTKNSRIKLKQLRKLCKLWGYTFDINKKYIDNIRKCEGVK